MSLGRLNQSTNLCDRLLGQVRNSRLGQRVRRAKGTEIVDLAVEEEPNFGISIIPLIELSFMVIPLLVRLMLSVKFIPPSS